MNSLYSLDYSKHEFKATAQLLVLELSSWPSFFILLPFNLWDKLKEIRRECIAQLTLQHGV